MRHLARIDARHIGQEGAIVDASMNSSLVPLLTSRCGFSLKRWTIWMRNRSTSLRSAIFDFSAKVAELALEAQLQHVRGVELDFLPAIFDFVGKAELRGNTIEIVRVDQEQQVHLLALAHQPLRHFERHLPAHAEPAEVVRSLPAAVRASRADNSRPSPRSSSGNRLFRPGLAPAGRKRVVRSEVPRQFAVDQDVAASSMHAEERRLASLRSGSARANSIADFQPSFRIRSASFSTVGA